MVNALMNTMPEMSKNALSADVVAQFIFEAATDGKNQLRYVVGEDAEMLLKQKQKMNDETFHLNIKKQFGI